MNGDIEQFYFHFGAGTINSYHIWGRGASIFSGSFNNNQSLPRSLKAIFVLILFFKENPVVTFQNFDFGFLIGFLSHYKNL